MKVKTALRVKPQITVPREWLPDMAPSDLLDLLEMELRYVSARHTYDMDASMHIRICNHEAKVQKKIDLVKRCSTTITDAATGGQDG